MNAYLEQLWTTPTGVVLLVGLAVALALTAGLIADADPHPVRKVRRDWARVRAWWTRCRAAAAARWHLCRLRAHQHRRRPTTAPVPVPVPSWAQHPGPYGPRVPEQRRRHAKGGPR